MKGHASTNPTIAGSLAAALSLVVADAATGQTQPTGQTERERPVLEEVVVTAQKRGAQLLQDVPISMTVMSGEMLDNSSYQGVNDAIAEMAGVSLYKTTQRGGSRVSIRGVSSSPLFTTGGSPTAYYLDNIPFSFSRTSIAPDANAYDLERVEVMKGPQGTLYGAAALGGVVRVLTKPANLDEFEAKARGQLSHTKGGSGNYSGDIAANVPLIPGALAIRGVIGYQDSSGWIDSPVANNVNDAEIKTYRLKVGAAPVENLRADFAVWVSRDDRESIDAGLSDRTTPNDVNQPNETDYDIYSLTLDYESESFSLFSSSSYMDYFNRGTVQIVPGLPLDFDLGGGARNFLTQVAENKMFAQEVHLYSQLDGSWQWSAGGYFRYAEEIREQTGVLYPAGPDSDANKSEQYAFFGEVTHGFLDGSLDLTVGLRYFYDDVKLEERSRGDIPLDPGQGLTVATASFNRVTPRVVLNWYANPDLTGYASFSQGFRSGFIQRGVVRRADPTVPNLRPDLLTNFEIGAKGTLSDGRARYDVALFYLNWEDVQQPLLIQGAAGVPFTAAVNAGDASGFGMDLAVDFSVTDNLTIQGSLGWNDLTFDQDILNAEGVVFFAKGSRLDESPKWTGNVRLEYHFPIGSAGYEGTLAGSFNYTDALDRRGPTGDFFSADTISSSDINFTVTSPTRNLSFTAFVDNLNDEDGIVSILDVGFPSFNSRLRPRTYGLRASYQY